MHDIRQIAHKLIDHRVIRARIDQIALRLKRDGGGRSTSVFWLANGAFFFAAELVRSEHLFDHTDLMLEVIRARNYRGITRGPHLEHDTEQIEFNAHRGRRIIILDDILDSGDTLSAVHEIFKARLPDAQIDLIPLFEKEACRERAVPVYMTGFSISQNPWLVGGGMDHNGYYRTDPSVWMLKKEYIAATYPDASHYPGGPAEVTVKIDGKVLETPWKAPHG